MTTVKVSDSTLARLEKLKRAYGKASKDRLIEDMLDMYEKVPDG